MRECNNKQNEKCANTLYFSSSCFYFLAKKKATLTYTQHKYTDTTHENALNKSFAGNFNLFEHQMEVQMQQFVRLKFVFRRALQTGSEKEAKAYIQEQLTCFIYLVNKGSFISAEQQRKVFIRLPRIGKKHSVLKMYELSIYEREKMLFNSFNYPFAKEGKNDNNTKPLPVFKWLQKNNQAILC